MPLKEIKKICCQFEWWNRDLILLKIHPVRGWVNKRLFLTTAKLVRGLSNVATTNVCKVDTSNRNHIERSRWMKWLITGLRQKKYPLIWIHYESRLNPAYRVPVHDDMTTATSSHNICKIAMKKSQYYLLPLPSLHLGPEAAACSVSMGVSSSSGWLKIQSAALSILLSCQRLWSGLKTLFNIVEAPFKNGWT